MTFGAIPATEREGGGGREREWQKERGSMRKCVRCVCVWGGGGSIKFLWQDNYVCVGRRGAERV